MAGIWNINSTYSVNNKKISTKLSFEVGEKFLARVIELNKESQSLLLKLLDGWKFSADIENSSDISKNKLLKFQVDGFENGKLKLKIVGKNQKSPDNIKDAIASFIKEKSLDLSNSDYEVIKSMVKYEIPLTKENISNIKSLVEFMDKIKTDTREEDSFIQKYLLSRNITPDSSEGENVTKVLKKFFNNLKKIDIKDVLTFIENNIDMNSENIESFNRVFKKSSTIYKKINDLSKAFKLDTNKLQSSSKSSIDTFINTKEKNENYVNILQKNIDKTYKNVDTSEIAPVKDDISEKQVQKQVKKDTVEPIKNQQDKGKVNIEKDISDRFKSVKNQEEIPSSIDVNKGLNVPEKNSNLVLKNLINNIANNIKEQINLKTHEMKDTINKVMQNTDDKSSNNTVNSDAINILNNNMNDFRIFNTISNSYYYMDLPFQFNNNNYGFKFIIKDDRKRGRKIDSTNVKIAASISTKNLGIVDAYLTVKDKNMDINIKSEKKFINFLKVYGEKILESLSDLGYNIDIDFDEKIEEMNISTCRDFFQDSEIGTINTRA
ncbi:MAG: Rhoptry protein [Clostridium sp.]